MAQTQSNVSTPNGSSVTAYITPELSNADRAYWDNYWSSPNRTSIQHFNDGYSSSGRFNCHGYAWNMAEGGPVRWIGYYVSTDEDVYMTDGSYIQVCNETYPGKVTWVGGDHSAVTTATPGRWISKWNKYPLFEHYKDDTPFPGTYAYYVSTKIAGSNSNLCSGTRDFIVQNVSGMTYSWAYSSTLSVSGPTNTNQLSVQRNGSSNGAAWVEVQISTSCSTTPITSRIDFTVGVPVISGYYTISSNYHQPLQRTMYNNNSPIWLPANQSFGINAYVTVSDAQSVSWTRASSSYPFSWSSSGATLYFSGSAGSTAYNQRNGVFDATVTNACGTTVDTYTWPVIVQGSGFRMATSPNPASDVITLNITDESQEVKALNIDEDVKIELYTFNGGSLVKKWKFKNDQKQFSLNISNVQRGHYVLVVKKAEFNQTTQIIVEK